MKEKKNDEREFQSFTHNQPSKHQEELLQKYPLKKKYQQSYACAFFFTTSTSTINHEANVENTQKF
jgi:hypothetical protein